MGSADIVEFEKATALTAIREVAEATDADLRYVAAFTQDRFERLFVADWFRERTGGEAGLTVTAEEMHSHLNLDFMEAEVFADLVPSAGRVVAQTTFAERATYLRCFRADPREGLMLTLGPDTPVRPFVDAVEPVLDDGDPVSASAVSDTETNADATPASSMSDPNA